MREQLVAAVRARLERIAVAHDPALALEPEGLDEARRLAEGLREDDGDIEARLMLGWLYWYQFLVLPQGKDRDTLRQATRALTPCFIAGDERLPEPLLPLLADHAASRAVALLQQAMFSHDLTRHCCIKAKGVLAVPQSGDAGPSGTLGNRNKPGI